MTYDELLKLARRAEGKTLETTLAVDQCRHVAASFAVLAGIVAVWPLFSSEIPPSRSGPLS